VDAWNLLPDGHTGVIVLMDSLSEFDNADSPAVPLEIRLGERSRLLIVAGDWPLEPIPGGPPGSVERIAGHFDARRIRAHFVGDLVVHGTAAGGTSNAGALFLNGLMLEGRLIVAAGTLSRLGFAHGTLLPAHGGLVVETGGNEQLTLEIDHAVCALVSAAQPLDGLQITDSIIGHEGASPDLSVDAPETNAELLRSSFFGAVAVQSVTASDCIFAGGLDAVRRQTGCVRFSYVPPGSTTPRRYRCQPELETRTRIDALREQARLSGATVTTEQEADIRTEVEALIRPAFVSRELGDPGYGQLELHCAKQIRTGAESGAEMGAFEFLKQPQREANLRDALKEYLRFGLDAGLFFVT